MSLLKMATKDAPAAANAWAGKVRTVACVPAWWPTTAVLAVVELQIGGSLTLVVHVATSKAGKLFASAPSSRGPDGETWVRHWELEDRDLREAVQAAAVNAYHVMTAQAAPASTSGAGLPF